MVYARDECPSAFNLPIGQAGNVARASFKPRMNNELSCGRPTVTRKHVGNPNAFSQQSFLDVRNSILPIHFNHDEVAVARYIVQSEFVEFCSYIGHSDVIVGDGSFQKIWLLKRCMSSCLCQDVWLEWKFDAVYKVDKIFVSETIT